MRAVLLSSVVLLGLSAVPGQAALLGTEVTVTNEFNGAVFEGPTTVTVATGGPELTSFGEIWDIDLEDESITMTCNGTQYCGGSDTLSASDRYIFTDVAEDFVSALALNSSCACAPTLAFLSATSFSVDFAGSTVFGALGDTVTLSAPTTPIPLPGAFGMLALAVAGLAVRGRARG